MRRGLGVVAGALLVAGCALGPNYHRPELGEPAVYRDTREETASIADLPWFDLFQDPTLQSLVREALDDNRDLMTAVVRVEQARDLAAVQRGELFPQFGAEGRAHRESNAILGGPTRTTGVNNAYLAAANAFWEIDVWGRIRRATEAARADMLATEAVRRGVVLSLVTGVAQAYFELRELDLELVITQRNVVSFRETADLFRRQYEGGVTSKLDWLRGTAALAQVAAVVPDVEQRIIAKENELSVLLGRPAGDVARGEQLTEQKLPPEVPVGVPSQLLERRPDLIQAEETLHAETARIGQAVATFFPTIGLTAVAGRVSGELASLLASASFWSAGVNALGPLFTFGRTWYSWRAARSSAEAAEYAYEQAVLVALQDVSDALTARQKLAEVRVEQEKAVASLTESLEMARVRYVGGLATYIEVLDAQQQLFPAELDLARTRRDELLAVVALYRALGGGWREAPPAPLLPQPFAP
jgi:multidrug efflux system outer membrane protein